MQAAEPSTKSIVQPVQVQSIVQSPNPLALSILPRDSDPLNLPISKNQIMPENEKMTARSPAVNPHISLMQPNEEVPDTYVKDLNFERETIMRESDNFSLRIDLDMRDKSILFLTGDGFMKNIRGYIDRANTRPSDVSDYRVKVPKEFKVPKEMSDEIFFRFSVRLFGSTWGYCLPNSGFTSHTKTFTN